MLPRRQRQRQRLLWRIQRRYRTADQTLRIGGELFRFTRVADPDRVLDEVAEEEDRLEKLRGRQDCDELHLPYWAEMWDSALGVAQWLSMHVSCYRCQGAARLEVLDLGCGMGLAGTVAVRLGCRVTMADIEPPALLFARLNSLSDTSRVVTRRLNWRTDKLDRRFDLILGADILYERAQWEHLERFWLDHLKPSGKVLLGEPGRQTGDIFTSWIAGRAWSLHLEEVPVPTREKPIRLFTLSLTQPDSM